MLCPLLSSELLLKMALTGQRIAMVDMVFPVLQHFHVYRRGGWSQTLPLKIFFSCSLGGGGRYFSVPRKCPFQPVGAVAEWISLI